MHSGRGRSSVQLRLGADAHFAGTEEPLRAVREAYTQPVIRLNVNSGRRDRIRAKRENTDCPAQNGGASPIRLMTSIIWKALIIIHQPVQDGSGKTAAQVLAA